VLHTSPCPLARLSGREATGSHAGGVALIVRRLAVRLYKLIRCVTMPPTSGTTVQSESYPKGRLNASVACATFRLFFLPAVSVVIPRLVCLVPGPRKLHNSISKRS
jgi:hypothetical protein